MLLLYLSLIWIAGIFFGSFFDFSLFSLIPGLAVIIAAPLFQHYTKPLLLVGVCLLSFAGGNCIYRISQPESGPEQLYYYNDKATVTIEGFVTNDPELEDNAAVFHLKAKAIYLNGSPQIISGKVLIRTSRFVDLRYGDILSISGSLKTPETFDTFDYRRYLATADIYSIMYYPSIERIDKGGGSSVLSAIYKVRGLFSDVLMLSLPEPQGALARAILLGIRDGISDSLMESFSHTGTAHLLAISGLHLSIIIGMCMSMGAAIFGRRYSIHILLTFLILWLYVIFAGMRPPIVRGAIMGSMYLSAQYLGRQRSGTTALCFAAAVMIGFEPLVLWNASFQLSFLAMAGLIFIAAPLRSFARTYLNADSETALPLRKLGVFIIDTIAVTVSAILATWPVIAYHFGLISFVGLPATFFALPALPFIIVLSLLVCIAGITIPLAGPILALPVWFFLSYLLFIIAAYNSIPFASSDTGAIGIWPIFGYYAFLFAVILVLRYHPTLRQLFTRLMKVLQHQQQRLRTIKISSRWRLLPVPILMVTILVWGAVLSGPDGKLHVSILNIGQGDAILIQTPAGQNILIDGGPSPTAINMELGKKLPFYTRKLDMVIVTQPHADHITGLVEVLNHYRVKHVVQSCTYSRSAVFNTWCTALQQQKIPVTQVQAGQRIEPGGGLIIDVLHPPAAPLKKTANDIDNNGLVLKLSFNKISFLFTADIYHEAEWYLISKGITLNSTVLKIAHHGSRTSSSNEFLEAVSPSVAVISAGLANKFGHPHNEVIESLYEFLDSSCIYTTAQHGTVEFISDGKKLWVKTDQ